MSRAFLQLQSAFHDPRARSNRIVEATIWSLILASIALIVADASLAPGSPARPLLGLVDRALLGLFALEYVLRVATYQPPDLLVFRRPRAARLRVHVTARVRFALRPMMLVDLITIAALVPQLRGLRALRLLRLLRTVKVFRYGNPFSGLLHAFERDRFLFALALSFLALQVLFGGGSLFLIERDLNPAIDTFGEGCWFAIVTITTVGFGDLTPLSTLGRVVTSVLMVGGMFTLALFAGIVGHSLLNAVLSVREEQFRMGSYYNHVVVCGYEEGMHLLIDTLVAEYDPDETKIVLIADLERPAEIPAELYWVRGDPTKESELDKVRIDRAAAVVVAGARRSSPQQADAVTLLTVFTIRSYLAKRASDAPRQNELYLVAEILDSENVEHARAAGADEVIETRRLGFSLLAHAIEHHGTADTLSQVVLRGESSLFAGALPEGLDSATYGEMTAALGLRAKGGLVIGVAHTETGDERVNPPEELRLEPGMHVLYLASERLLEPPKALRRTRPRRGESA
ncbi:potassium channel family protein [Engelhardtia mirabilis]|uniref:BK channel n=1 Tax=Engelhardtia mirabilis TaxID=2528011 RepID=A0A518BGP4_9BACT|nr:Cyclic nucleotide-gated potassium channel [Planctomycetes bacterium Pla133]QDV00467.1 Cyclic nucleotide-gated potassium channel [Planctomycetes bacterium Pla86]